MVQFFIENAIDFLTAVAAISTGFFIFLTWRTSRKIFIHQTLANLEKEYRSPEMGFSIDELWKKYHEVSKNTKLMVKNYIKEWDKGGGGTIDDLNNNWHLQRRRVSQFYHSLGNLYTSGVLPPELIFSKWSKGDLKIIPDILIPIEDAIRERRKQGPMGEEHALKKLYCASVDYSEKKTKKGLGVKGMYKLRYYFSVEGNTEILQLLTDIKTNHGIENEIMDLSKNGKFDEEKEKDVYERYFKPRAKILKKRTGESIRNLRGGKGKKRYYISRPGEQ